MRSSHAARCRAYTLLEVCLALIILAVMAGLTLPLMHGIVMEGRIATIANNCRDLALDARRSAMEAGISYAIYFNRDRLVLMPLHENGSFRREETESIRIPKGTELHIRRNAGEKWQNPNGQAWIFQTDGICEHLQVLTQLGKCWNELEFNPLTATASEGGAHYE